MWKIFHKFERNQFQVVNAKIKIYHRKWPFVIKKASKSVFFISSKYVDMGIKRSVFLSQIQQKKAFYKIMKNSQVGAEKLGKTAEFVISLIFSTLMPLDRMFSNIFTNRLLRLIRLLIHISTYFDKIKYHLNNRLFGHK